MHIQFSDIIQRRSTIIVFIKVHNGTLLSVNFLFEVTLREFAHKNEFFFTIFFRSEKLVDVSGL